MGTIERTRATGAGQAADASADSVKRRNRPTTQCYSRTATHLRSGDIRGLTVIVAGWWRLIDDADSGRRRLTLFPDVAPEGLTCQRCVAAAFPRPSSVT